MMPITDEDGKDIVDDAIRYQTIYREMNIYVIVCEAGIHIGIENRDQFLTISSLGLIEVLINDEIESGMSILDVAALAFTASLDKTDLPRIIHDACMHFVCAKKAEQLETQIIPQRESGT